ncbi:MAG: hypothetical protein K2K60_05290 [Clostridia bacterium]|nr:hypothetical protein [Clostridia bacterium]
MTESATRILSLDREEMSELEKELFLKDLKRVTDEYFETEGKASIEVTRSDNGFLVCVLLTARRIKSVKKPQ